MRFKLFLFIIALFAFNGLSGQVRIDTVIAKKGDGIFSILRNAGMDPATHYEEFYKLNEKHIRNGSELINGKKYLLPDAPDSFKNRGTRIVVNEQIEKPIFDKELSKLAVKDSTLKHSVYYIMYSPNLSDGDISERSNNFIIQMAKELLVRSAKVYILEGASSTDNPRKEAADKDFGLLELGEYSGVINKKYLMNNGSYQRVLVLQELNGSARNYAVNVSHYSSSKEGLALAGNLQKSIRKYAAKRTDVKKGISIFDDEIGIYLAKNILAPVTILSLDSGKKALEKGIEVKAGKTCLAKMIMEGIAKDYAQNSSGG
ncbi:hypothetical protein [Maribacter sp. 4U21]|uniref:hypothetical protein n=1 Tax=Maribacter sp. 4U21 TaxID=1889779 RepID=UPI00117DC636|nr:hypothetical protein [Maribacter sp. 4U21]